MTPAWIISLLLGFTTLLALPSSGHANGAKVDTLDRAVAPRKASRHHRRRIGPGQQLTRHESADARPSGELGSVQNPL